MAVTVHAHTNLFDPTQTHQAEVEEGQSLREIIGGDLPGIRAMIGAHEVPEAMWPHTRPRPGQQVHLYVLPQGGDNNVLRAIAGVIVAVLSFYGQTWAANAYGAAWGAAAGAGISICGPIVINRSNP